MSDAVSRRLLTAELLSIGSELTVGETRDTNAGEIARSLTGLGVRVTRLTALPDDLVAVTDAFAAALERSDLVISTGGLGPTPDDLTREAIAAVCDETPEPDPDLEAWLRELWRRRDMPFPELNLKQAWLIGSAVSLPNPNGTAPGWFVGRPDGRVIVALPGPPREMRPMWAEEAVPRLQALGLGASVATRTYRLAGIGESQVAELLGEAMLRTTNPIVATYARVEAVDVRISAVAVETMSAEALVESAARRRRGQARRLRVGERRDDLERRDRGPPRRARLDARGGRDRHGRQRGGVVRRRRLAALRRIDRRRGPGRDRPRVRHGPTTARRQTPRTRPTRRRRTTSCAMRVGRASSVGRTSAWPSGPARAVATWRCRSRSWRRPASATCDASVFLAGGMGRSRAALAAAAVLLEALGETPA